MPHDRIPIRFTLAHVLVALLGAAIYLALRRICIQQYDFRYLAIAAPAIAGTALSISSAAWKKSYVSAAKAAVFGIVSVQIAWLCEVHFGSSVAESFVGIFDWWSVAAVAALGAAAAILATLPLSLSVCLAVRAGFRSNKETCVAFALISLYTIVAGSAYERYNDPVFRFRVLGDETHLFAALAQSVRNGDSVEHVVESMGPWAHEKSEAWKAMFLPDSQLDKSLHFPEGIQKDDKFVYYSAGVGPGTVLQFREGKLVNFDLGWVRTNAEPWWR